MRDSATLAPPIGFRTEQRPLQLPTPEQSASAPKSPSARLVSLDAYRGFVMLLMASSGLALKQLVMHNHLQGHWQAVAFNVDHVEWRGCSLWDLIQPSFTFIVGVAMPFSLAKRQSQGQTFGWLTFHAVIRALILVALGIFLRSIDKPMTNFTFEDTLTQIGLGYTFAFLLSWTRPRWQVLAIVVILVGYWAAFAAWRIPPENFNYASVGVSQEWYSMYGLRHFSILHPFAAHWDKNTNISAAFDVWFLNLFPRVSPFKYNVGGYLTLSFIPTLATMLFGLLAGNLMKSNKSAFQKFGWLVVGGVLGIAVGWTLDHFGVCPNVKRIWTPSWVLYSGGWACLLLAVFYLVVDMAKWRWIAFPAVVVGMNSIAMYCMADGGIKDFIRHSLRTILGSHFFDKTSDVGAWCVAHIAHALGRAGPANVVNFGPVIESAASLFVLWLIVFWMYRRKIFLRI